ncbi:hypothetical protein Lser_V15G28755 [Lactuca serriola]
MLKFHHLPWLQLCFLMNLCFFVIDTGIVGCLAARRKMQCDA